MAALRRRLGTLAARSPVPLNANTARQGMGLAVLSSVGRHLSSESARRILVQVETYELERFSAYFRPLSPANRESSVKALERLFFDLVSKMGPTVFIEAGAKDPLVSRKVSKRLGESVSIIAFEANPYTFKRFDKPRKHARLRVDYRNVALATEPGEVKFNVRRRPDGGAHADGQGSLLKHVDHEPGHIEVSVEATTLDHVLGEFGFPDCMLWVDVEGALREVLSGGIHSLKRAQAVFIEVEDRQYWGGQWLAPRVQEFFFDAGLSPVARDFQSTGQYNLLFVRNDLLESSEFVNAMDGYYDKIGANGRGLSARRRYRIASGLQRS